jgi:hypothetical protein
MRSPYPFNDFHAIDSAGIGLGMKSRLHVYWASLVRSNGLLAEVQPLTPPLLGSWKTRSGLPIVARTRVTVPPHGASALS